MAFEVVVRKWGNSLGVVFPKEFIGKSRLRANEKVLVDVVKEADLRRVFGTLKAKESGQEFKDLVREGWK